MEALYTAIATSEGGRNGHVRSSDGLLDFEVRSPKAMGGQNDNYTNPEQLFAAGYSACFGSALNHAALLRKLRITSKVTSKVSIGKKPEGGFMLAVEMEVEVHDVDRKVAQELLEAAHQICPYSNAIRGNVEVKLTLK